MDPNNQESQKTAVSMWSGLSSQLITAALAVIAVEGALITFVLDKYVSAHWVWIPTFISVALLISSVWMGGKGINAMATKGSDGDWNIDHGAWDFQLQALMCLLGLIFFGMALLSLPLLATKKEDAVEKNLIDIKQILVNQQQMQTQINSLEMKIDGNTTIANGNTQSCCCSKSCTHYDQKK